MLTDRCGQRDVPAVPIRVVAQHDGEGRQATALGPGQALDAGAIGTDGDDLSRVAGLVLGVQQSLQQRPRTRDQDDDAGRRGQVQPVRGVGRAQLRLLVRGVTALRQPTAVSG